MDNSDGHHVNSETMTSRSKEELGTTGKISATLRYSTYADILASTISTLDTPTTVGLFAGWGCGKSYLMQKIKENLERRSRKYPTTNGDIGRCFVMLLRLIFFNPPKAIKKTEEVRFISVYFNALEYAGSDHLWAGLVTRLVYSVEWGIGRLPSAIFRAKRPRGVPAQVEASTDKKKTRFTTKKLCGKVPLYFVPIVVLLLTIPLGIWFLVYAFGKQNEAILEYNETHNGTLLGETKLDPAAKQNLAIGSVMLTIPMIAFLRHFIPIVLKFIHSHASQIQKMFSRPDFTQELGVMAKVKSEIRHLSLLVRFMELFEQRRIVVTIFIDDLDKLPQQNIAPLLQAIKILLSDPSQRFVSIIAMDPYSVSDSLEMGIQSQFPAINISGHKFLKQMVQVPFTIPTMNSDEKENLFKILQKSKRISNAEVTPEEEDNRKTALKGDVIDGAADIPSTRVNLRTNSSHENRPLLPNITKPNVDRRNEEVRISLDALNKTSPESPFDELGSVVIACDFVLSELTNPEILPFVRSNLQEMLRLVGTAKVATRILFSSMENKRQSIGSQHELKQFKVTPRQLTAWIVLIGQWPYRMTWVIQQVEDRCDADSSYKDAAPLLQVYRDTEANFTLVSEWRKLIQLDCDPDDLEHFLEIHKSWLNVGFLTDILPHTISLDRSLKRIVAWASVERDLKSYHTHTTKQLCHMDVDDVTAMIKSCCGDSNRLEDYVRTCNEHHISGLVLLRSELDELKKCLDMSLGDWTLFSYALVRLKTVHKFKFT